MGPFLLKRYSIPIFILPKTEFISWFNVFAFCSLYITLSCKWSCKFSPTFFESIIGLMPNFIKSLGFPIPESSRIFGDPTDPADNITSLLHETWSSFPFVLIFKPVTILFLIIKLSTSQFLNIFKFFLCWIGFKKALTVFNLNPFFWLTLK